MTRPPRRQTERRIDGDMLVTIGSIGLTSAIDALVPFDLRMPGGVVGDGGDPTTARTMAFTTWSSVGSAMRSTS